MKRKAIITSILLCIQSIVSAEVIDIFITAGQSNAGWNNFAWSNGIRSEITSSGLYSNPVVLSTWHSGRPLGEWYDNGSPAEHYQADFFNDSGTGVLQAEINSIILSGGTPNFRGLFWFQGEADGKEVGNGSVALYPSRWNDMIENLNDDIGHSNWNYLMNTVGNSGADINNALQSITDNDNRGILFDTQQLPYKLNPNNIHGYDHNLVGKDNVTLFNTAFIPEPSTSLLILLSISLIVGRRKRVHR